MRLFYTLVIISSIVILTLVTVLVQFSLVEGTRSGVQVVRDFNWLSGLMTFLNFSMLALGLVLAHIIFFQTSIKSTSTYFTIALPYLVFILFTIINYSYSHELLNIFQFRTKLPVDTPSMGVFATNVSIIILVAAMADLAVVWFLSRKF